MNSVPCPVPTPMFHSFVFERSEVTIVLYPDMQQTTKGTKGTDSFLHLNPIILDYFELVTMLGAR